MVEGKEANQAAIGTNSIRLVWSIYRFDSHMSSSSCHPMINFICLFKKLSSKSRKSQDLYIYSKIKLLRLGAEKKNYIYIIYMKIV